MLVLIGLILSAYVCMRSVQFMARSTESWVIRIFWFLTLIYVAILTAELLLPGASSPTLDR